MRSARMKAKNSGCYYHLINRAAGGADERPFGRVEKRKFMRLVEKLSRFYTIDIISLVVMSNHFHIVVFAPANRPSDKVAITRFNRYYKGRKDVVPLSLDDPRLERVRDRLRDISDFMKDLQQGFTCWFNKTRPTRRRGRLWQDRFKSVIIQNARSMQSALWACIKYIELNPVRAKIVEDPADYRFSTWGGWSGKGKHPYAQNVLKHLRCMLGFKAANWTIKRVYRELYADMQRTIVAEASEDGRAALKAYEEAKKNGVPLLLRFDRRTRYWVDSVIIGNEAFVLEMTTHFRDREHAEGHQFGKPILSATTILSTYRRLRKVAA
jgi:REP element-mobilizing transposase RayT